MNAISKRLLSWLCVIAMVLSFVPVMDLSGFAVTTKAASTLPDDVQQLIDDAAEIQAAAVALDPATATTCPMCGAENITWSEIPERISKDGHYYIPAGTDSNSVNFVQTNHDGIAAGDKVCILLNEDITIGGRFFLNKAVTLNIAGDGSITQDGGQTYSAHNGGMFQVGTGATINLYGGKYIGTQAGDPELTNPESEKYDKDAGDGHYSCATSKSAYYGNFSINSAAAVLNIFDGAEIVQNTTRDSGANIVVGYGGTVNMYGGKVTGGKGFAYHYSGTPTSASTVEAPAEGKSWTNAGGNVYLRGSNAEFNMYGGEISGGSATNGGNIYAFDNANLNIVAGTIKDGNAVTGGNMSIQQGSTAVLDEDSVVSGGMATGTTAADGGGNILYNNTNSGEELVIKGQILDGKTNGFGGNIGVVGVSKIVLDGAVVANGQTLGAGGSSWGGNIRAYNGKVEIKNGSLVYGGSGKSTNGLTGSNVAVLGEKANTPELIISDSIIVGGINYSNGGASYTVSVTDTEDKDGDGDTTDKVDETRYYVGTKVVLSGATKIVTSYKVSDEVTATAQNGYGMQVKNHADTVGQIVDVSGLTDGAEIWMSAGKGTTFVKNEENAQQLVKYFKHTATSTLAVLATENSLYVGDKPYEAPVKPEATLGGQNVSDEAWAEVVKAAKIQDDAKDFKLDADGKAMCPACGQVVEWVEATYPGQKTDENGKYHFYIDADTNVAKNYNWAAMNGKNMSMCFMLLNGETAKEIGGLMGMRNSCIGCTLNVMGDGIITSDGTRTSDGQFGVISMQGNTNTVNLYGGTFIYTGDGEGRTYEDLNGNGKFDKDTETYKPSGVTSAAALNIKGHTNTVNMYDGVVIGPETQNLTKVAYNVRMEPALASGINTFNMYGGLIRNGVSNDKATGGNVHLHYNSKYAKTKPTFNMYGGTIENGSYVQGEGITSVSSKGGNIYAGAGSQLNIYGGVIRNGKAVGGGNIYANDSSLTKVNLNGGTITGGEATNGGNIYAYAELNLNQYALVEEGQASATGGNIYVTGANGDVTQNAGSEVRNGTAAGNGGGNVFVNTNGTYDMKGGKIYGGENVNTGGNANAGNVLVQGTHKDGAFTDAYFNMSGNAEIYGGIAPNQAGNIRVYIGTFTMTDNAKIYGGDGIKGCDELWMVDGNLVMDGNATVESTVGTDALSATIYRRNNTITLKGNASIYSEDGTTIGKGLHADDKETALQVTLQVDNAWTGYANINFKDTYKIGDTVLAIDGICGTEVEGVFTKGGSHNGTLLCYDANDAGIVGVNGDLVIAAAAVADKDGNVEWVTTNEAALAAYDKANDAYVVLTGAVEIAEDAVISTNGQDLALSGSGKVSLIDPANKDFKSVSKVTATGDVELETNDVTVDGDRYITLENGNEWSAHYVEMILTSVSLRNTAEPGLYYKASYKCDAALRDHIYGYGVALKAHSAPAANEFNKESATEWTAYDSDDFKALYGDKNKYEVATISGALTGILKEESATRSAEQNVAYADVPVYAAPYLIVNYDNNGKGIETYLLGESRGLSFNNVLGMIDNNFDKYDDNQKNIITSFVAKWDAYLGEFENF